MTALRLRHARLKRRDRLISMEDDQWKLDFVVAKSLRYHAYRRSFWDTIDNTAKILTVVSGTAVLVIIVGDYTFAATLLSIIVALTSASDVVLGFSQKARNHDGLYRSFSKLAQDITEKASPTEDNISAWRRRRLEIEMDEPFIMDLLERRCSGEEARARGCRIDASWKLTKAQTILSQFAFWPALPRDDTPESC